MTGDGGCQSETAPERLTDSLRGRFHVDDQARRQFLRFGFGRGMIGAMRTSRQVTIEDAARYEDGDALPVARVAGGATFDDEGLHVTGANGQRIPVEPGQWVVRYAAGDVGVMDDGEYQRYFG